MSVSVKAKRRIYTRRTILSELSSLRDNFNVCLNWVHPTEFRSTSTLHPFEAVGYNVLIYLTFEFNRSRFDAMVALYRLGWLWKLQLSSSRDLWQEIIKVREWTPHFGLIAGKAIPLNNCTTEQTYGCMCRQSLAAQTTKVKHQRQQCQEKRRFKNDFISQ